MLLPDLQRQSSARPTKLCRRPATAAIFWQVSAYGGRSKLRGITQRVQSTRCYSTFLLPASRPGNTWERPRVTFAHSRIERVRRTWLCCFAHHTDEAVAFY